MQLNNLKSLTQQELIKFPLGSSDCSLKIGFGLINTLANELEELGVGKTIFLVTDPALLSMSIFHDAVNSMKNAGFSCFIYSEVEHEPTIISMEKIHEFLKQKKFDAVIGIGGGSTLDSAKFAAILGKTDEKPVNLLYDSSSITGSLPLILLPTTSGTGSEISPYIVVSNNGKKIFIANRHAYADLALVDPMLTVSMPEKLTAYTGLDALTHAVEGVVGNENPYTRAISIESVRLIFTYLPRAVHDGNDLESRYYLSFASVLGMLSYLQGGGLYAHSMSYILTDAHKIPHGLGCGLSLPYTLKLNELHIQGFLKELGMIINPGKTLEPHEVPEFFQNFLKRLQVPSSLKELGIDSSELPQLSARLLEEYPRLKNPRELTPNLASLLVSAMHEDIIGTY